MMSWSKITQNQFETKLFLIPSCSRKSNKSLRLLTLTKEKSITFPGF